MAPESITQSLRRAVLAAGDLALRMQFTELQHFAKGDTDFATAADIAAQKVAAQALGESHPDILLIGEEDERHEIGERSEFFTIDPIDGTFIYSLGAKDWGVIGAYFREGRPQVGFIYLPARQELLYAERDRGTFFNAQRVNFSARPQKNLSQCAVASSIGRWNPKETYAQYLPALSQECLCIRALGSAAADSLQLLSGVCAIYLNYAGKIWDHAVTALAVEEAGGLATTPNGLPLTWTSIACPVLCAANPQVHQECLCAITA